MDVCFRWLQERFRHVRILARNGLAPDCSRFVLVGDHGRSPYDVFKVGTFHGCACAPQSLPLVRFIQRNGLHFGPRSFQQLFPFLTASRQHSPLACSPSFKVIAPDLYEIGLPIDPRHDRHCHLEASAVEMRMSAHGGSLAGVAPQPAIPATGLGPGPAFVSPAGKTILPDQRT